MPTIIPTTLRANPERPWLGLAHFTAADRDYFYGREAEIRELTERVRRAPLTILYGVSGYGKSSLIGAGLSPFLTDDGYSVTHLSRCYDDLAIRPLVGDVIAAVIATHSTAIAPNATDTTLWEFFHDRRQPWFEHGENRDKPAVRPVLILDQFEEIFTRGEDRSSDDKEADATARAHARDFLHQLADLIENRPPASLRERLESGATSDKRELIRLYDFQARPLRIALSLRDDFLGRLERWRRVMPGIMEHRVELRLLAGPQAYLAVYEPGTKRDGQPPIIPPEVAAAIVRAAAGVPDDVPLDEIEAVPPILSLLCERLNAGRLAAPRPPSGITDENFSRDQASEILGNYYEEKLSQQPQALRGLLEDRLVSDSGLRENITFNSALAALQSRVPDAAARLHQLVDDRILVIENRAGLARVEFTHDALARIAMQSRGERLARARRKKAIAWIASAMIIAGASWGLALWALQQRHVASLAAIRAANLTVIAHEQTKVAEEEKRRAEEEKAKAVDSEALALQQQQVALNAKKDVELKNDELVAAKNYSDAARVRAEEMERQAKIAEESKGTTLLKMIPYQLCSVLVSDDTITSADFWAPTVNYYDDGKRTRAQVIAEHHKDNLKYPYRSYMVTTEPVLVVVSPGEEWRLNFEMKYTILNQRGQPSTGHLRMSVCLNQKHQITEISSVVIEAHKR